MNEINRTIEKFLDYYCALGCSRMPNEMYHSDIILFLILKLRKHENLERYFTYSVLENLNSNYGLVKDEIESLIGKELNIDSYIESINKKMRFEHKNKIWNEYMDFNKNNKKQSI